MKKSISLIMLSLAIVSCKMESPKGPQKGDSPFGRYEEPTEKNFSAPEIQIGKRICDNLVVKKKMLDSYRTNQKQQLIFTAETKACGQSLVEENAVPGNSFPTPFKAYVSLTGSRYEFIAPTRNKGEYIEDIITRDSGLVAVVCNSLNGSGDITRQYAFESHSMVVKFLVQNSMDKIEIFQKSPAPKGGYAITSFQGISFIGSSKLGPVGLEKEHERLTACGNNQSSSIKQTWQDLTTDL